MTSSGAGEISTNITVHEGTRKSAQWPNAGNQRLATIREPRRAILLRVRGIALFSLFFGLTRSRNPKVTADLLHEVVGNLTMSRHGGPLIDRRISPPRMVSTFANQVATMINHDQP